jgi:hypothetical protein
LSSVLFVGNQQLQVSLATSTGHHLICRLRR